MYGRRYQMCFDLYGGESSLLKFMPKNVYWNSLGGVSNHQKNNIVEILLTLKEIIFVSRIQRA